MKKLLRSAAALLLLSTLVPQFSTVFAQGTAFTYQGRLNSGTNPASGLYDFQFTLSNAPSGGSQIGSTITQTGVGVTNGLFTTSLDFGSVFTGESAWLAISVRTNGGGSYVNLTPLQPLTPTPYATYAAATSASGISSVGNGNSGSSENFFLGGSGNGTTTGSDNTALGVAAFQLNSSGSYNTAIGLDTLENNTTGSYNTAIGLDALHFNGTGTNNTALGFRAGFNLSGGNNNIYIGNYGLSTENNTIRIGTPGLHNSTYIAGNVSIGLTPVSGLFGLTVSNSTSSDSALLLTGTNSIGAGMAIENDSSGGRRYDFISTGAGAAAGAGAFAVLDDSVGLYRLTITPSGNIGIGTTAPSTTLQVNGTVTATAFSGSGTGLTGVALLAAGNTFTTDQTIQGQISATGSGGALTLQNRVNSAQSWQWRADATGLNATSFGGSINQALTITTNGNVGVGTTAPNSDSLLQVKGMVRMGSETGTSEAPVKSILMRRINSTSSATGQVLARSIGGIMTLERDGTAGGLIIKVTGAYGGVPQITGFGINASGATVNVYNVMLSGGGNSTTQIFTDAQKIGYCRIMFGDVVNNADTTTVELMRGVDTVGDSSGTWAGTVTSTVNQ